MNICLKILETFLILKCNKLLKYGHGHSFCPSQWLVATFKFLQSLQIVKSLKCIAEITAIDVFEMSVEYIYLFQRKFSSQTEQTLIEGCRRIKKERLC